MGGCRNLLKQTRIYYLIKYLSDVGLGLPKPLGEQLGALDGDEVGLALVGNGLGQQGLAAPGRPVEEHPARGHHAELEELLGVLDGVLDQLLQFPLDGFQAADVRPADGGDLHQSFPQGAGCALTHRIPKVVFKNRAS